MIAVSPFTLIKIFTFVIESFVLGRNIDEALNTVVRNDIKIYGTTKITDAKFKKSFSDKVDRWWKSKSEFIEVKHNEFPHIHFRFYRKHFKLVNDILTLNNPKAVSIFTRAYCKQKKSSQYKYICNISEEGGIDLIVSNSIQEIHKLKSFGNSNIPTICAYLERYENILDIKNPRCTKSKINIITSHFNHLLDLKVNEIKCEHLLEWLESHKVERSPRELNSGLSQYDLADSTIKGAISTLRAMIKCASEEDAHPFTPSPSLWSNKFKIIVNNKSDRYYSDEELQDIFTKLNQRDMEKKRNANIACAYADFLTPLVWLCLMTGLRPRYALKIRKCDINWKAGLITIKADDGKISKDQTVTLSESLKKALQHWLMHPVYHGKESGWLFPNYRQPQFRLQDYKYAVNELKAAYGLAELNFRTIRHTFATMYTAQTSNIFMTKEALHHKSVQTTERYVHLLSGKQKQSIEALADRILLLQSVTDQNPWQPPENDDDLAS